MSLLRPSIAGRLLRAGGLPARRVHPATARFESSTTIGTPLPVNATTSTEQSTAVETKEKPLRHNQPDYGAEVDQASS